MPQLDAWRLTLTFPILNAAREVNLVVAGEDKAWAVRAVKAGADDLPPSGMVDAARTVWLVDQAAVTVG